MGKSGFRGGKRPGDGKNHLNPLLINRNRPKPAETGPKRRKTKMKTLTLDGMTIKLNSTGYGVQRMEGDLALIRSPFCDVPLQVCILIRRDGAVVEWYTAFNGGSTSYWRWSNGTDDLPLTLTDEQVRTIALMQFGKLAIFGSNGGRPSRQVQEVAFSGKTRVEIEALGNSGIAGFYA